MLPSTLRVFIASEPVDFRKSYDGLCGVVRSELGKDPQSPSLYVFRNKRADQIRILWWDHNGYCIWMKRLGQGTFGFSQTGELSASTLALILENAKKH